MTKRALGVFVVVVNLLLLACLILTAYAPPAAEAQAVSRRGEFILIAAEAEVTNDTIYLLDLAQRQMHAVQLQRPKWDISNRRAPNRTIELVRKHLLEAHLSGHLRLPLALPDLSPADRSGMHQYESGRRLRVA